MIMSILSSASKLAMLFMVGAVVLLTGLWIEITEPMKTIALMIVSFYFGNKTKSLNEK